MNKKISNLNFNSQGIKKYFSLFKAIFLDGKLFKVMQETFLLIFSLKYVSKKTLKLNFLIL